MCVYVQIYIHIYIYIYIIFVYSFFVHPQTTPTWLVDSVCLIVVFTHRHTQRTLHSSRFPVCNFDDFVLLCCVSRLGTHTETVTFITIPGVL